MDIRINTFNEKLSKVLVVFQISEEITKCIPIGIIVEWQSRFCWHKNRNQRNRQRQQQQQSKNKKLFIDKIKQSICEPSESYASEWLYEAIINWSLIDSK